MGKRGMGTLRVGLEPNGEGEALDIADGTLGLG